MRGDRPSRSCCCSTLPSWVGNAYYINVASQILLFAVFALALNVLVGYGGLVSLGHAGLFAIAGYTAALLLQAGLRPFRRRQSPRSS